MPAGVSTGAIVQGQARALAIHLLASGFSPYYVAKRIKRDYATVVALRDSEFNEIQSRKPTLAALHERNALLSLTELAKRLEQSPDKFSAMELNVVGGTASDKMLALRGDAGLTIRHEHLHARLSDDDVWAFMAARAKRKDASSPAGASPAKDQAKLPAAKPDPADG